MPTARLGLVDTVLDWPRSEPEPALAVLQGLFFDRIAPPKSVRRTISAPALVIGHPNDPVHPFADSDELVRELPNARLLEAESIVELRVRPERPDGRDRRLHRRVLGRSHTAQARTAGQGRARGSARQGARRRHSRRLSAHDEAERVAQSRRSRGSHAAPPSR